MMDLGPYWRCMMLATRLPRVPTYAQPVERQILLNMLARRSALPSGLAIEQCDWKGLLRLAHRFALIPVFAERSEGAAWGHVIPPEVRAELRERLERTMVQNRILFSDALRVAEALDEAHVPHQFMKGMAILAYRSPEPVARQIDDIDVLIDAENLARVEAALVARGWTNRNIPPHATHPLVMDSPSGSMLEVHITLRAPFVEEIRRSAVRVEVEGVSMSVTGRDALVRHLCHHSVKQHENDPRYLPRQLVDLQYLAAPAVHDEASELCYETLRLVEVFAGDPMVAHALGALLFPTRHTALHRAVQNSRQTGFRGIKRELSGLTRLPGYLVKEI